MNWFLFVLKVIVMFKEKSDPVFALIPALLFVLLVIYLLVSDPTIVGPY